MTRSNFLVFNDNYFEFQKRQTLTSLGHKPFSLDMKSYISGMYLNPTYFGSVSDLTFIKDLFTKLFNKPFSNKLISIIESYRNKEKLMFSASKFYRDNLSHMVKVSIIGFKILNLNFNLNGIKTLMDYFLDLTKLTTNEFMNIWYLSSLFHDIGQPYDIFTRPPTHEIDTMINMNLLQIEDNSAKTILRNFEEYFNFLSEIITDVTILTKLKDYIESGGNNDHGVVSSYVLFGIAEHENLLEDEKFKKIILHSCRCILFHTCFEKLKCEPETFSIKDYPLDFFLYFIDHIQECGRKVKDAKTSEFKLLDLIDYQEIRYSYDEKYIESCCEFIDEKNINDTGFDYRIHIKDKYDGKSNIPIFLSMFKKEDLLLPQLRFKYTYLDTTTKEKITYQLEF